MLDPIDVYGWVLTVPTPTPDDPTPTASLEKAGRASLVLVYEPAMPLAVLIEYAGTRVLEAETEDVARQLLPDAAVLHVLAALWQQAPPNPDDEPAAVAPLRALLGRDETIAIFRQRRDQHVALSRANQTLRAANRSIEG